MLDNNLRQETLEKQIRAFLDVEVVIFEVHAIRYQKEGHASILVLDNEHESAHHINSNGDMKFQKEVNLLEVYACQSVCDFFFRSSASSRGCVTQSSSTKP